jgi:hypothetical protein
LPAWIVILKYDKKNTALKLEKSNKYFRSQFKIKDDFTLRKYIRKVFFSIIYHRHLAQGFPNRIDSVEFKANLI